MTTRALTALSIQKIRFLSICRLGCKSCKDKNVCNSSGSLSQRLHVWGEATTEPRCRRNLAFSFYPSSSNRWLNAWDRHRIKNPALATIIQWNYKQDGNKKQFYPKYSHIDLTRKRLEPRKLKLYEQVRQMIPSGRGNRNWFRGV